MLRRLFAGVYRRIAKRDRRQPRLRISGRLSWEELREQFDAQ
jgi:hypothetical protein